MDKKLIWINDTDIKYENQILLQKLSKKHAIFVRDIYSKDYQFQSCPWPQANLMGKEFPICEFIICFNKEFAENAFANAEKMDYTLLDELLKDYFIDGQEGFNFPIEEEIISSPEEFQKCLNKLYKKFPQLIPVEKHEWKLTLTTCIDTDVNLEVLDTITWEGEITEEINNHRLKSSDIGYRKILEFFEVPSLQDISISDLSGHGWYKVFASYGDKTAVMAAVETTTLE